LRAHVSALHRYDRSLAASLIRTCSSDLDSGAHHSSRIARLASLGLTSDTSGHQLQSSGQLTEVGHELWQVRAVREWPLCPTATVVQWLAHTPPHVCERRSVWAGGRLHKPSRVPPVVVTHSERTNLLTRGGTGGGMGTDVVVPTQPYTGARPDAAWVHALIHNLTAASWQRPERLIDYVPAAVSGRMPALRVSLSRAQHCRHFHPCRHFKNQSCY
jgi:hypothetical protein